MLSGWLISVVVRSRTRDSEVVGSIPTRSNNLEQVTHTRGDQANSAFHPFRVGK